MILLGYHLRVCLLCSVLVFAVMYSGGTKDDCQGSPEDKPPLGIRDVHPVPHFFQRESYLKHELVDFASIYHTHKARWSSSQTGSAKTKNAVYKEAMNQIIQPSTAMAGAANFNLAKAEVFGVNQDRTFTYPFEGFAMTLKLSPSEVGQISQVSVPALQSELSGSPPLQREPSMLSNANILLQHTVMDSRSPKNYQFQQINHVYSQIEPSPHTYTTEDHSREAHVNFPGFVGAQENTGVSGAVNIGYARSTLRFLKPQAKTVDQNSRSTDDLSTSAPSASISEATEEIKPAASHFRSQQAWQTSVHGQQSGKVQHGSGPLLLPKYSGVSHSIIHPGKRRKSGLGSNVQLDTLNSNQATRGLNQSSTGKFKPFQIKGP